MGSERTNRGEVLWAVISVIVLGLCLVGIIAVGLFRSAMMTNDDTRPIEMGDSVSGFVLQPEGESYALDAEAGEYITISLDGRLEYDTYLELYAPGGNLLAEDDDSGGGYDSRLTVMLPEDGLYTIVARGYSNQIGLYTLSIERAQTQGTLRFGEAVESSFHDEAGQLWQFEGVTGDMVIIEMNSRSDLDPYLTIYTPDAAVYLEDDDSGGDHNARIAFTLPQTGIYLIQAHGFGGSSGSYELLISRDEGSPDQP